MTQPFRFQLSRAAGWRMPPGSKSAARPSKLGNPYRVGDMPTRSLLRLTGGLAYTQFTAVLAYKTYARHLLPKVTTREQLAGVNLGCYCALDTCCHVDIILDWANDLESLPWLVTIGTKSVIVPATTISHALLAAGILVGTTARPATTPEVLAWNEVADLDSALRKVRTVADRRELLGVTGGVIVDEPEMFG